MTSPLTSVAQEIDFAATRPVAEVELALTRIVARLANLPAFAKTCPEGNRNELRAQVIALRTRIGKFNRVMERSAEMFGGYARQAGFANAEYNPGGMAHMAREPAFIALNI